MADLRKVVPGEDFNMPAATYNAFVDAANFAAANSGNSPSQFISNAGLSPVVVQVKNTSSSNVERFHAMALGDSLLIPATNEKVFLSSMITIGASTPADTTLGNWCVLLDSIPAGQIGRAILMGLTKAKVNIAAVSDLFVDTQTGSTVLKSGSSGPAEIIYVAGGRGTASATGEQWALIKIGGSASDGSIWAKITGHTAISGASNRWSYSWVEQQLAQYGVWQDKPGGKTSSGVGQLAYNTIESNNSASGVQGNSVNVSNLPTGYALQPVTLNPVVRLYPVLNCATPAAVEWQFSYENAIDGSCS